MSNVEKLQKALPDGNYAALVYSEHNRFYFNGFPSTDGVLLVTKGNAYFLIDSRYIEAAREQSRDCEVVLLENEKEQLTGFLKKDGIETVGVEAYELSIARAQGVKDALPFVHLDFSNRLNDLIEGLRMVKEPFEIANMQKAQDITDAAFEHVLGIIKPGVTEKDVALEIEYYMKKHGASGPSFDLIAVSGENSSRPHGVPGTRKIQNGDFLTIDIGAVYNGYCSDMTRTVAIGKITDEQKKVYDTVRRANLAVEEAIAPGKKCRDIDKVARDIIYDAGYEGCFGHGLGHSVGLLIHEKPFCSPKSNSVLAENMIMTDEPGIYLEGRFGVRIEDMVLVTKEGCRIFTKCKKDLVVL